MKLNDLRPLQTETFSGTYRMTGKVAAFDDEGIPYIKLRLSSCKADLVALVVIDAVTVPDHLRPMELLVVKGRVCVGADESWILLTDIRRPSQPDVAKLPVLQTLPRVACPLPEYLDQLVQRVRSLRTQALQEFVKRVLERRDCLQVFLKAPASRRYHHSYPGGLLKHSLEVAQGVWAMIECHEPGMSTELRELGFVAGLLHDIGKTYTVDCQGRPTAAARLCDHADLTLEACAHGLAYLDRMLPDAALSLRHIWTCASPGARYGKPAVMTLARYVRDADGQSALADNQRMAYRQRNPRGFAALNSNVFWQPSLDQAS